MQLRDKVTSTGIDQRFCTRITVTECHSPPAGVGTLRSFNAAAMARGHSSKLGDIDRLKLLCPAHGTARRRLAQPFGPEELSKPVHLAGDVARCRCFLVFCHRFNRF
jgi:hypothetical protein